MVMLQWDKTKTYSEDEINEIRCDWTTHVSEIILNCHEKKDTSEWGIIEIKHLHHIKKRWLNAYYFFLTCLYAYVADWRTYVDDLVIFGV